MRHCGPSCHVMGIALLVKHSCQTRSVKPLSKELAWSKMLNLDNMLLFGWLLFDILVIIMNIKPLLVCTHP